MNKYAEFAYCCKKHKISKENIFIRQENGLFVYILCISMALGLQMSRIGDISV